MLDSKLLVFSRKQALEALSNITSSTPFATSERVILYIRARLLAQAESLLLLNNSDSREKYSLLLLLRLAEKDHFSVSRLVEHLIATWPQDDSFLFFVRQSLLIDREQMSSVCSLGLPSNSSDIHPWHRLQLIRAALWLGNKALVDVHFDNLPTNFQPPERLELHARRLMMLGDNKSALAALSPIIESHDATCDGWELAYHLLKRMNNVSAASTLLQRALVLFPGNHRLLARSVVQDVMNRRPVVARRTSLLERLFAPLDRPDEDRKRSNSNLCFAYEVGGRPDFLLHMHHSLSPHVDDVCAQGNYALQLSSMADSRSFKALQQASKMLIRTPAQNQKNNLRSAISSSKLRVGIISPDLSYHPVGRFYSMLLASGFGAEGELHSISLCPKSDSVTQLIKQYSHQRGGWHDIHSLPLSQKLSYIRSLNLDIAIDLAGWTNNAYPDLFASRVAPLQINYLGFWASSGLPEMDIWLGDDYLFPQNIVEDHSEKLWRLSRCFLAWSPFDPLPEYKVQLTAPPTCEDIVFGSFNHMRKLSEGTLRLWGRILNSIPGSRIALKAYTSDDPGASSLLRKRMLRCGLDPNRVIWLPMPHKPEDHLRQYGLMDIALDPFPNGGCTTTCEALWMGVPVITLQGDRYVSRMSTAVLHGAELSEWVALTEQEYLNKAIKAADQIKHIRDSRAELRRHVQSSPLGDSRGLSQSLWSAFNSMTN